MPIRTASLRKRISANGRALHRATQRRIQAAGAEQAPSETELALIEERRTLKEDREKRREQATQPRPSAVDRLLRTHHAKAKDKPKAEGDAHKSAETKKPKARRSRAEKHAEKAAAIEAARRPSKKPATK